SSAFAGTHAIRRGDRAGRGACNRHGRISKTEFIKALIDREAIGLVRHGVLRAFREQHRMDDNGYFRLLAALPQISAVTVMLTCRAFALARMFGHLGERA